MQQSITFLPQRRASATKSRLIEAGVRLFTQHAGVKFTTREIAREAKVNHALISYHFRSMSELMKTVVEQCIDDLREELVPLMERLVAYAHETRPNQEPLSLLEYVRDLFGILTGPSGAALLKAFANPDSAALRGVYGHFSERVLTPLHHTFAVIAAKAGGISEQSLEASVLAQCMTAQCMAFFRGARPVLMHLGKESFSSEDIEEISRIVSEALTRTAGGPLCSGTREQASGEMNAPRVARAIPQRRQLPTFFPRPKKKRLD